MLKIVLKKRASPGSKGHQASVTSHPWQGAGRARWQPGSGERGAPQGRWAPCVRRQVPSYLWPSVSSSGKWGNGSHLFFFIISWGQQCEKGLLKHTDIRLHFMKVVSPPNTSQLKRIITKVYRPLMEMPDPPQPDAGHECFLQAIYSFIYETVYKKAGLPTPKSDKIFFSSLKLKVLQRWKVEASGQEHGLWGHIPCTQTWLVVGP